MQLHDRLRKIPLMAAMYSVDLPPAFGLQHSLSNRTALPEMDSLCRLVEWPMKKGS